MGLENLAEPLQHGFMRNAFAAIVLVGIICGVMGVLVTLRGLAFMGDAIAHAVFPGVVISYVVGANYVVGALIAAMVVSLAIGFVTQSRLIRVDTAIGVFFVGAFALGSTAAQALLGPAFRVTRERGRVVESPYGPVLTTVHPSAILRAPSETRANEQRAFVRDLTEAARWLARATPRRARAPARPTRRSRARPPA